MMVLKQFHNVRIVIDDHAESPLSCQLPAPLQLQLSSRGGVVTRVHPEIIVRQLMFIEPIPCRCSYALGTPSHPDNQVLRREPLNQLVTFGQ